MLIACRMYNRYVDGLATWTPTCIARMEDGSRKKDTSIQFDHLPGAEKEYA